VKVFRNTSRPYYIPCYIKTTITTEACQALAAGEALSLHFYSYSQRVAKYSDVRSGVGFMWVLNAT